MKPERLAKAAVTSMSTRTTAAVLGLLVLASWGTGPAGAQNTAVPERIFPADALREDLGTLWAVLDEGHGGLERYTPRDTLKRSFDETATRLTEPMTELDFYRTILPLIAAIKDGHTSVRLSDAGRTAFLARPVFFPFELRFVAGRAYIFRNLSERRDIGDGSEVVAINGTPMAAVLRTLLSLVPCDAGLLSRRLRLLEVPSTFGQYLALAFGQPDSFRLRIRSRADGAASDVTVPGIAGRDIGRIFQERYPEPGPGKPLYELTSRGSTAVLTIRGFGDDRGAESVPYPEFLQRTFRELEARKVPSLVIDLRGNGGGRDEYGRLLFAHFMDRPFQYYKALEVKKDRFDFFKYVVGTRPDWPAAALRKNARGWYDVTAHPNVGTMRPETPRFTGRTVILVDGLSFSTTGETTSLFHFHKKATFAGEECGAGYYGNTSGSTANVVLPRTGIQVRVPLVLYTLAVDGYPRDRGIVPDIPVTPTIEDLLARRDVVMEGALRFLARGTR